MDVGQGLDERMREGCVAEGSEEVVDEVKVTRLERTDKTFQLIERKENVLDHLQQVSTFFLFAFVFLGSSLFKKDPPLSLKTVHPFFLFFKESLGEHCPFKNR